MNRLRGIAAEIHFRMPGIAVLLSLLALLAILLSSSIYSERQADRHQAQNLARKGSK
jgi:hypothetical protein